MARPWVLKGKDFDPRAAACPTATKKGLTPKLQRPWEHGWVITHKINEVLMRIRKGRKMRCVHTDRLTADDSAGCPSTGPLLAFLGKVE
ncbi:hypothetical protein FOCC_FOCC013259, partial [Frankliniella occidentalis]